MAERTEWVEFGGGVLQTARASKGWSRETLARRIPVSAKTIERYEEKDAVPRHLLPKFARELGLSIEIEDGSTLVAALDSDTIAQLAEAVAERLSRPGAGEELGLRLEEVERRLDDRERPTGPRKRRAGNGGQA